MTLFGDLETTLIISFLIYSRLQSSRIFIAENTPALIRNNNKKNKQTVEIGYNGREII